MNVTHSTQITERPAWPHLERRRRAERRASIVRAFARDRRAPEWVLRVEAARRAAAR